MVSRENNKLLDVFIESFAALDIDIIAELLHDKGDFYNVDSDEPLNKIEFIKWLENEFKQRQNQVGFVHLKNTIDTCIGCEFSCKVVLFDDGLFPLRKPKVGHKIKHGFLPKFENDKIISLKVCGSFLVTENRYSRPSDFDDEVPF